MKPFRAIRETGRYTLEGEVSRDEIVQFARKLVARQFQRGRPLTSSEKSKAYFTLTLAEYDHEVFGVLFLDNQHQVLRFEVLFRGTIDGCSVYPREVVKRALFHNAAAVIFVHNHPSGVPDPSVADMAITKRLKQALEVVDVRTLDHFVVGGSQVVSFAEKGLL